MGKAWVYLAFAIVLEVLATSALTASEGFSRKLPAAVALAGYGIAFYLLSLALKDIPLGVAYAVWSGVGIAILAVVGALWFGQPLSVRQVGGIFLIISGIVLVYQG